jgi:antitoxin CptB
MKELDLLLTRYLRERWPEAPPAERALFEALLEWPDPQLASHLVAGQPAEDPALQGLLDRLRGRR